MLASSGLVGDFDEDPDDIDEADVGFHFQTGVDQRNLERQSVEAERDSCERYGVEVLDSGM